MAAQAPLIYNKVITGAYREQVYDDNVRMTLREIDNPAAPPITIQKCQLYSVLDRPVDGEVINHPVLFVPIHLENDILIRPTEFDVEIDFSRLFNFRMRPAPYQPRLSADRTKWLVSGKSETGCYLYKRVRGAIPENWQLQYGRLSFTCRIHIPAGCHRIMELNFNDFASSQLLDHPHPRPKPKRRRLDFGIDPEPASGAPDELGELE